MKVLGILGSPRRGGNSDMLLDEMLKGASSVGAVTEKIYLGDLNFKGCIECSGCDKTGICVLKDDMTPIYDKLREADIIVAASPIFFLSITAQLKALIDRCQSEWVAKYKLKLEAAIKPRKGAFICVSGYKENIFCKDAEKIIKAFFKTINVEYIEGLFVCGVEKPGDVKADKGALEKARKIGTKLT